MEPQAQEPKPVGDWDWSRGGNDSCQYSYKVLQGGAPRLKLVY